MKEVNNFNDEMINIFKEFDRVKRMKTKEPSLVMTLDDFSFYLAVNEKSIGELSKDEFIRFKNNFILAIDKELSKYYNFVDKVKN